MSHDSRRWESWRPDKTSPSFSIFLARLRTCRSQLGHADPAVPATSRQEQPAGLCFSSQVGDIEVTQSHSPHPLDTSAPSSFVAAARAMLRGKSQWCCSAAVHREARQCRGLFWVTRQRWQLGEQAGSWARCREGSAMLGPSPSCTCVCGDRSPWWLRGHLILSHGCCIWHGEAAQGCCAATESPREGPRATVPQAPAPRTLRGCAGASPLAGSTAPAQRVHCCCLVGMGRQTLCPALCSTWKLLTT